MVEFLTFLALMLIPASVLLLLRWLTYHYTGADPLSSIGDVFLPRYGNYDAFWTPRPASQAMPLDAVSRSDSSFDAYRNAWLHEQNHEPRSDDTGLMLELLKEDMLH